MNTSLIPLAIIDGEPRVDSRTVAAKLGVDHHNTCGLIDKYSDKFQELGILPFKTEEINGRGQPAKFALLNENQSYFLLTLVRNTDRAVECKLSLVRAFDECRQQLRPVIPDDPLLLFAHAVQQIEAQHRARLDALDMQMTLQGQKVNLLDKHVTTLVKVITSHRQPPVPNANQIGLDLNSPAKPRREYQGGTHASPRPHERQGHWRDCNGNRVWVRPAQINKKSP